MLDQETIKSIKEMWKRGETITFIAKVHKVSRPTVRKIVRNEHRETSRYHSAPRVSKQKANRGVLGWRFEEKEKEREFEETTQLREHPSSVKKSETWRNLESPRKEELNRIEVEQEARLEREVMHKRLSEREEKEEKHRQWVEGRKNYAVNFCLPLGTKIPETVKFRIKDAVGEVLKNRSENEYGIQGLIEETVEAVLRPFLNEQEARRKAEDLRRKEEEAKRKRERKIELIKKALVEVDKYVKNNHFEAYVSGETIKMVKNYIYIYLLKTLPEEIWFAPEGKVREMVEDIFKKAKKEIEEAEEAKKEDEEKQEKRNRLVGIGMGKYNAYINKHQSELEPFEPGEREEGRQYLERELKREIVGTETDQEVAEITEEILDEFFFEEDDE